MLKSCLHMVIVHCSVCPTKLLALSSDEYMRPISVKVMHRENATTKCRHTYKCCVLSFMTSLLFCVLMTWLRSFLFANQTTTATLKQRNCFCCHCLLLRNDSLSGDLLFLLTSCINQKCWFHLQNKLPHKLQ